MTAELSMPTVNKLIINSDIF